MKIVGVRCRNSIMHKLRLVLTIDLTWSPEYPVFLQIGTKLLALVNQKTIRQQYRPEKKFTRNRQYILREHIIKKKVRIRWLDAIRPFNWKFEYKGPQWKGNDRTTDERSAFLYPIYRMESNKCPNGLRKCRFLRVYASNSLRRLMIWC